MDYRLQLGHDESTLQTMQAKHNYKRVRHKTCACFYNNEEAPVLPPVRVDDLIPAGSIAGHKNSGRHSETSRS